MGHALTENRHGLVMAVAVSEALNSKVPPNDENYLLSERESSLSRNT